MGREKQQTIVIIAINDAEKLTSNPLKASNFPHDARVVVLGMKKDFPVLMSMVQRDIETIKTQQSAITLLELQRLIPSEETNITYKVIWSNNPTKEALRQTSIEGANILITTEPKVFAPDWADEIAAWIDKIFPPQPALPHIKHHPIITTPESFTAMLSSEQLDKASTPTTEMQWSKQTTSATSALIKNSPTIRTFEELSTATALPDRQKNSDAHSLTLKK